MSFDDLVLFLPVRRIAFQRRIAVLDRHPLVEVDGFQVGGLRRHVDPVGPRLAENLEVKL